MKKDALLVEYQVLQKFRLEWSMAGNRWGYYFVPLCGTILWITWNISRENLFIGILVTIALLCFWRYVHHSYDDAIKKLYLRIVEIEEETGMEFTRRYLTKEMQKSKLFNKNFNIGELVTSKYILEYQNKCIFGSRGHVKWDLASGIVISLLCVWLTLISLPEYPYSVFIFHVLPLYAFYFGRKDQQD